MPLHRRRVAAVLVSMPLPLVFAVGVSPIRAEEGFPVVSDRQEREASQVVPELIDAVGRAPAKPAHEGRSCLPEPSQSMTNCSSSASSIASADFPI